MHSDHMFNKDHFLRKRKKRMQRGGHCGKKNARKGGRRSK